MGVGMPATLLLNRWAKEVAEAWGAIPYLVGSALEGKQWRDVDVRVILEDEEYDRIFGHRTNPPHLNTKWAAFCTAFAVWGREATGLPIDFQIDRRSEANAEHSGPRSALGVELEAMPIGKSPSSPESSPEKR